MDVDVLRQIFDRHMTARGGEEAVITAEVLQDRLSRLGAGVSLDDDNLRIDIDVAESQSSTTIA